MVRCKHNHSQITCLVCNFFCSNTFISTKLHYLPRMRSASRVKVIGAGVHIYIIMFVDEKKK